VGLAKPGEWALVAAGLWLALWIVAAGRRRRVLLFSLAALTAGAVALAAREARRRGRAVAIVVNPATSVRVAPYGSASAAATVEAGAALLVDRTLGGWLEVHRQDGVRGWVLATEVTPL
jgi:Bacterial SH3 domain